MARGQQLRPGPCLATPQASCAGAEVWAAPRGSGGRAGVDPTCLQVTPLLTSHVPSEGCSLCRGLVLRDPGCITSSVSSLSELQGTSQVVQWLGIHLSVQGGAWDSIPGPGGSHMPQGNQACAPWLLSPRARSLCPTPRGAATVRSPRAAAKTQCSQDRQRGERKARRASAASALALPLRRGPCSRITAFAFLLYG